MDADLCQQGLASQNVNLHVNLALGTGTGPAQATKHDLVCRPFADQVAKTASKFTLS